jgi:hypothetical protein
MQACPQPSGLESLSRLSSSVLLRYRFCPEGYAGVLFQLNLALAQYILVGGGSVLAYLEFNRDRDRGDWRTRGREGLERQTGGGGRGFLQRGLTLEGER